MIYREGQVADLPQIAELTNGGAYGPTNIVTLGGQWIVAEDRGNIVGVIWCFIQAPQAYIDYFYVRPEHRKGKIPARLLVTLQHMLKASGVKYVRGVIRTDNADSLSLSRGMGCASEPDYTLVYKEI